MASKSTQIKFLRTVLKTLKQLKKEEVDEIKDILEMDGVVNDALKNALDGAQLAKEITKLETISPDDYEYLLILLRNVERTDLADSLVNFSSDQPSPAAAPTADPELENSKRFCYILNNYKFRNSHILGYARGANADLIGYVKDKDNIEKTFRSLKFKVTVEENKTADEMSKLFAKWSSSGDLIDAECVVVVILTHGSEYGYVYGIDSGEIELDDVVKQFHQQHPDQRTLFFVSACRGNTSSILVPNTNVVQLENPCRAASVKFNEKFPNTFVFNSTSEGTRTFVHDYDGSVFITEVCKVLNQPHRQSLWQMVTNVNRNVSEQPIKFGTGEQHGQCPEVVSTLSSDFIFRETSEESADDAGIILKNRNPCYIVVNSACGTHKKKLKRRFKEYVKMAKKTFGKLKFDVEILDDLTNKQLEKKLKGVKKSKLPDAECVAFVVFTCGGSNGQSPVVYGSNGIFLSIETFIAMVTENADLRGRPKLFFMVLNPCTREQFLKTDGEMKSAGVHRGGGGGGVEVDLKKAQAADTFLYYVNLNDGQHSEFVNILCENLIECRNTNQHIGDIALKVNAEMLEVQASSIPEACSTLTNLVYFAGEDENIQSSSDEDIDIEEMLEQSADEQHMQEQHLSTAPAPVPSSPQEPILTTPSTMPSASTPGVLDEDQEQKSVPRNSCVYEEITTISDSQPQPRFYHVAVVVGDEVVVCGGGDGYNAITGKEVWTYNTKTIGWKLHTTSGDVPTRTWGSTGWLYAGCIHLFGGIDGGGRSNNVHRVDLKTNEWVEVKTKGSPPSPGCLHASWKIEEKLFVFGGVCDEPTDLHDNEEYDDDEDCTNQLHMLQLDEMSWSHPVATGRPPSPRRSCAHACVGGVAYLFGGYDGRTLYTDIFMLQTTGGVVVWTKLSTSSASPCRRFACTMTGVDENTLMICGGCDGKKNLSDVWLWDIERSEWTIVKTKNMRGCCAHTTSITDNKQIFLFGGEDINDKVTCEIGKLSFS